MFMNWCLILFGKYSSATYSNTNQVKNMLTGLISLYCGIFEAGFIVKMSRQFNWSVKLVVVQTSHDRKHHHPV